MGVNSDHIFFVFVTMLLSDQRAPVSARRGITLIPQNFLHQGVFKVGRVPEVPARFLQRRREAISGQRDQNDVKAVFFLSAIGDGVG